MYFTALTRDPRDPFTLLTNEMMTHYRLLLFGCNLP